MFAWLNAYISLLAPSRRRGGLVRIEDFHEDLRDDQTIQTTHFTYASNLANRIRGNFFPLYRPPKHSCKLAFQLPNTFTAFRPQQHRSQLDQTQSHLLCLPYEIRYMIWSLLIPNNQVIHIVALQYDVKTRRIIQCQRPDQVAMHRETDFADAPRRIGSVKERDPEWPRNWDEHDPYLEAGRASQCSKEVLGLVLACHLL